MTEKNSWHSFAHSIDYIEIIKDFGSNIELGLHPDEIEVFKAKYGKNILTPKKTDGPIKRFFLQFNQPLLYILILSAIVTLFLKEFADSSVIFGVVIINAIVGFIQESKALKSLEALAKSMSTQAVVVRNGKKMHIDSSQVVPGDILFFVSGDKVAADVRLITSRDLQVDESALTGESMPVEKSEGLLPESTALADRKNMLYASTLITYGSAKGIVIATGDNTEVGKISQLISKADSLDTPLTIKISQLSVFLLWVIITAAIIAFAVGVINGQPAKLMFLAAISVAVAAIPEGLPAAMTITLAIGVSRMVKRKAIIRKLPAVETLGSTTVICSDKTGTLTENQMTVMEIFAGNRMFNVFGSGYNTDGEMKYENKIVHIDFSKALRFCMKAGYLCNDSKLLSINGHNTIQGDPTEGALIVAAIKANLDESLLLKQRPRLDTIPFESEYQYMATLHKTERHSVIAVKGAVEKITNMCSTMLDENDSNIPFDKEKIMAVAEGMASRGLRVLAFAIKYCVGPQKNQIHHEDVESDLIFIGLQAMIDPPRPEVIEAVKKCHTAGIKIKMITGDHALTASSIAKVIGIVKDKNVDYTAITGKELESFDDEQLKDIVQDFSVFARVTPEQKLKLVKALQARGEVCAMTGDGVNDAPALKQANIGIAMGITGTEVAKESADMVLTDDNFASIVAAVEEGRGVFDNIKKFILWTLPTNVAQGFVMMMVIFLNREVLPILPAQILWINMSTAILLGLMLAFEPKEEGIMERKPISAKLPIIDNLLIYRNIMFGVIMTIAVLLLFEYELAGGATLEQARGVTVSIFIMAQSFYLLNCRSSYHSIFKLGIFSNPFIWLGITLMFIFQTIFLYVSPVNKFFKVQGMDANSMIRLLVLGLFVYCIVELEKFIRRVIAKKRGCEC
ncbi:MAG: cation-transporting P-type ATPase [Endomicrobiaceae bacterium]|nr:cation-transporting P-type ATPase [Endomicrobiaceae bacterium]